MVVSGPLLVIAALPPSPGSCDIRLTVALADGTFCRGRATITAVAAAIADRAQQLCELSHLVSHAPLRRSPLDALVDPIRSRELVGRGASLPDPNRIAADLMGALGRFKVR